MSKAFDEFGKVYVSFSAGKDSTVMLHLVAEEARRRRRSFGVLMIDLEAQYSLTISHAEQMRLATADCAEWFWVCAPLSLRNAVSMHQPQWQCWEPKREADWVRTKVDNCYDGSEWEWFAAGMEFEDFVSAFGEWYADGKPCCCMVGIRADESLNRFRTIASSVKERWQRVSYSTRVTEHCFNWYPIYDWSTEDIWVWHYKHPDKRHNELYDIMHKAGLTIHQMRICQPYGDDQRRGLWLYHLIEPQTWGRVVARVNGANSGALYVQETGNMTGYGKVTLPEKHTWRSFAELLLASLPQITQQHFAAKVDVFRKWWMDRGYPEGIPDSADPSLEAKKMAPSWRRICKAILRNDYWCKTLGFSQHKSGSYERYLSMMKKRREKAQWRIDEREAAARGRLF